jgi:hypothetical protein
MDYEILKIKGIEAEQMVRGILRGGHVFQGKFYFHSATGFNEVAAIEWKAV